MFSVSRMDAMRSRSGDHHSSGGDVALRVVAGVSRRT